MENCENKESGRRGFTENDVNKQSRRRGYTENNENKKSGRKIEEMKRARAEAIRKMVTIQRAGTEAMRKTVKIRRAGAEAIPKMVAIRRAGAAAIRKMINKKRRADAKAIRSWRRRGALGPQHLAMPRLGSLMSLRSLRTRTRRGGLTVMLRSFSRWPSSRGSLMLTECARRAVPFRSLSQYMAKCLDVQQLLNNHKADAQP